MVTHATVPPIPTMATEPPYTTGTTNNVGIFGGLGASNIEYLFCKLTTNNVSWCILSQSVSQRSSTPNTTFTWLTNGQIYYYFVRARDSITTGDMSDWSASTHSTQDSTPPVTTIIAPASWSIQTGNFEVRFSDTDTLSLWLCAYKIEDNEKETLWWTIRTCNTDILINQSAYCSHQWINTCVVYWVALDSAGNTWNVASRSFTIDTTPWDTTPPVITQVTPVPSPTNDTTPNYTFHSTEVGTITYGGSCSPFLDVNAVTGNNTITFNTLANWTYSDCTIEVKDAAGNVSNTLQVNTFTIDTIKPTCTSFTYNPASWPVNTNVTATCNASESVTYQSPSGTGVYTFTTSGSYVFNFTDLAGNTGSATATVTWIDKAAPVLAQITAVPSPTNDTTPNYTFSSTEAGTITYGGSCTSTTTTASIGNTTITFNTLPAWTYSNCTIVVTDSAGNQSNILAVNTFIVDTSLPTAPNLFALSGTDICPSLPFAIARSGSTNISSITGGSQLSGYRYEVYSNSGMVTGMVLSGTTITTWASIIVSSLPLGIYYMRVRAINTLGDMTASNTISFTLATQYCRNNRWTWIVIATPNIWLRNVDLDTVYRSDPIVIFGLSWATPISISRWTLFINNATGAWWTTGIVTSNDTIYIEMISSTSYDTTVNSYLSVLGLTWTFSLTTKKSNCVLSAAEKIVIQNIYSDLKDQYDNDLSKLADFLTIFQSMVEDESALGNSCNLEYLLWLIEEDLWFEWGIDTSDHITPNCKEYTIGYDNDQWAYYAPEMLNRYYFINRESIIRHLDYYNPGDCHINTYENNFRIPDSSDDPMRHIAPNGKIYNLIEQYGGFSANEFASSKYFDSLDSIVRYIDIRNPAKTIWNHDIDTSFTPILYVAPNGKTYKIYKTDRWYMSYKLMSVRYYTTLAQLQNYIITNNPNK